MTEIKLSCGFEAEVDETAIDDAELLEQLTELEDGSPTAAIRIMKMLGLDKNKRTEIYGLMKDETGRTPADAVINIMTEIFQQIGSKKK